MTNDTSLAAVTDRVRRLLVAAEFQAELNGENGFFLRFDDFTGVFIEIEEQLGDEGDFVRYAVECWATVLHGVPVTQDVIEYLAFPPVYTWGGIASVRNDDDTAIILFRNVLLGNFLDEKELTNTVVTIASTADTLIQELYPRFGGKRLGED